MTATTEPTAATETRMTAPEWLNLATLVSANTRDQIEMVLEHLNDELLVRDLGVLVSSTVEAFALLEADLRGANLPDGVLETVEAAVGAEQLRELWWLIVTTLGSDTAGEDLYEKLKERYPEHAKRLGVASG
jgi:hypothetical protein